MNIQNSSNPPIEKAKETISRLAEYEGLTPQYPYYSKKQQCLRMKLGQSCSEYGFSNLLKTVCHAMLFNIDSTQWNESEFLLNRNSRFLITGFDEDNNIVKAKYLGE